MSPTAYRPSFQVRFFVAAFSAAVPRARGRRPAVRDDDARQTDARIEATLVAEGAARRRSAGAQQAAVGAESPSSTTRPIASAQLTAARVTFIAADGRVVGDSSEPLDALARWKTTRCGPKSIDARETGIGRAHDTAPRCKIDMLYIAVPVAHPAMAFVRMALPLTDVRHQLRPIFTATLVALSFALVGAGRPTVRSRRRRPMCRACGRSAAG